MSKKGLSYEELCRALEESDFEDNVTDDSYADPVYRADVSDELYSSSDDEAGQSNSVIGKLFHLQSSFVF